MLCYYVIASILDGIFIIIDMFDLVVDHLIIVWWQSPAICTKVI